MDIVSLVTEYALSAKYALLFVLYFVEGPISLFISSVIASKGLLSMSIIFTLVIAAELLGDIVYYFLGKFLPRGWVDSRIEASEENGMLKEFEMAFRKHPILALTILKVTGIVAIPGIIYMGRRSFVSFKKYFFYATLISFVKNGIYASLGYFVGLQLGSFITYYNIFSYVSALVVVLIVAFFVYKVNQERVKALLKNVFRRVSRS